MIVISYTKTILATSFPYKNAHTHTHTHTHTVPYTHTVSPPGGDSLEGRNIRQQT